MMKSADNEINDLQHTRKHESNSSEQTSKAVAEESGGSFGNTEESQELEGMVGEVMDKLSV
jgi:hypothetical protein